MESLEARVSQAKERYQSTVYSAKDSRETLSALPQFPVNDKFVLNQDEAWYTLSIELQVPIDTVMLQVNGKCVCVWGGERVKVIAEKREKKEGRVCVPCIICPLPFSPPSLSCRAMFLWTCRRLTRAQQSSATPLLTQKCVPLPSTSSSSSTSSPSPSLIVYQPVYIHVHVPPPLRILFVCLFVCLFETEQQLPPRYIQMH